MVCGMNIFGLLIYLVKPDTLFATVARRTFPFLKWRKRKNDFATLKHFYSPRFIKMTEKQLQIDETKRLVAVNFRGLLPCDLATQVHLAIVQAKNNVIGDIEMIEYVYRRKE